MALLVVCVVALVFGFVGSMPLAGPIALMALSRAANEKYDEALRISVGAALAEGIYASIAFWGFATFLARYRLIVPISHGATAVILTGLGVRFMFWHPVEARDAHASNGGTLLLGFSVSAVNPTLFLTWSTAVAFLYSKGLAQTSALSAIPFGASAALGVAAWFVVAVALLRKYGGKVPQKAMTYVVRSMGLALVALGVWAGVQLVQWLR